MKLGEPDTKRPDEFEAGGSSPPGPGIPPQLAEDPANYGETAPKPAALLSA